MNPYGALVRGLGRTRGFAWVASRTLPPIDALFRGRRRSLTNLGTGLPLCYLTTTGCRSGEPRTVPLLYVEDDGETVVFASNWGKRRHPAWAYNLDATPEALVAVCGVERSVRARRARADEELRFWPRAQEMYPGYAGYRRRASREIRVYVLEVV